MTNSFTLTDAQRYRLGVNYQTIPVRDAVLLPSKFPEAYSRPNIQVNCPLAPVGTFDFSDFQILFFYLSLGRLFVGVLYDPQLTSSGTVALYTMTTKAIAQIIHQLWKH